MDHLKSTDLMESLLQFYRTPKNLSYKEIDLKEKAKTSNTIVQNVYIHDGSNCFICENSLNREITH